MQGPVTETLNIYLDDVTGVVATWGPVIFIVWRAHHSTAPIEAAELAVPDLVARYGGDRRLFYVHRAPGGAQVKSTPRVMEAAMAHFERVDARVAAAAVAIEADGFAGSIIRSVTAGVLLVRKTAVRSASFKDARDGVRWLGAMSPGISPFDGHAVIQALQTAGYCRVG